MNWQLLSPERSPRMWRPFWTSSAKILVLLWLRVEGATSVGGQEAHLFPIMEKQFPYLAKSYREKLNSLAARADSTGPDNLQWVDDKNGHLYFRSHVKLPCLFALSEPLSRFQSYRGYAVPVDEERKFYSTIGLVPAYFANMNRVVCFNLWGEQATDYFAPYSRPLQQDEDSVWRLDPTQTGSVEISS